MMESPLQSNKSVDEQFRDAIQKAIQNRAQEIVQDHIKQVTEELQQALTLLAANAAINLFQFIDMQMNSQYLTIRIELKK